MGNKQNSADLYLVDYEFIGSSINGLDIIQNGYLSKNANAVLVTSHFEEEEIISRCDELNVGLVPKGLASFIPFKVIPDDDIKEIPPVILIDDDMLTHMVWKMEAKKAGRDILTFLS